MRAITILLFALAVMCLVMAALVALIPGIGVTEYVIPGGQTVTIADISRRPLIMADGSVVEGTVVWDREMLMLFSVGMAGVIVFAVAGTVCLYQEEG